MMTMLAYGWANVDRPTLRRRPAGSGPAMSGDPRVTIARDHVRRHA
jgi:paraquat-inducible protein A